MNVPTFDAAQCVNMTVRQDTTSPEETHLWFVRLTDFGKEGYLTASVSRELKQRGQASFLSRFMGKYFSYQIFLNRFRKNTASNTEVIASKRV